jgi:AraC-like DNA-binding protein
MGRLVNKTGFYDRSEWLEFAEASGFRAANLAAEIGVSQRQLERYVKRQFGRSPQRWLTELRMSKALLLIECMDSVKEVAYSLGFKQVSHFCREFKKFHGLTCGQYATCLSVAHRRWGKRGQCIVWIRNGQLSALICRSMSLLDNKCRKPVILHHCLQKQGIVA